LPTQCSCGIFRNDPRRACISLSGGCPGRQLFLSGEGDADAAVFASGMIVGAAISHNFGLASSPAGIGPNGAIATIIGLVVCIIIGLTMRRR